MENGEEELSMQSKSSASSRSESKIWHDSQMRGCGMSVNGMLILAKPSSFYMHEFVCLCIVLNLLFMKFNTIFTGLTDADVVSTSITTSILQVFVVAAKKLCSCTFHAKCVLCTEKIYCCIHPTMYNIFEVYHSTREGCGSLCYNVFYVFWSSQNHRTYFEWFVSVYIRCNTNEVFYLVH